MLKSFISFIVILLLTAEGVSAQYKYACFKSESNPATQLMVCFKNNKALYIKFKGQKRNTSLHYSGTRQTDNTGGSPPFFWTETYTIIRTGRRVSATCIFTNAGAYELELSYINNKTKIKQRFTIIEALAGENFSPYRNTPCF